LNILIVGAGFSGAVIARELAEAGHKITVIDSRSHIGGNAYDYENFYGIRIHKYGPHIFHTNNKRVVEWIMKYGEWETYFHKVKAQLNDGRYVTLPVNKETKEIVGEDNIIETFFRPYTEKMWGMKLEDVSPNVLNRVPVRDDDNELYFPNDEYQFMPKHGYTKFFENILDHENIEVRLNTTYSLSDYEKKGYDHVFNGAPIDEFFEYRFGELPYRSVRFHHVDVPSVKVLPVPTVNFTNTGPYTRITEWKNYPCHGVNDMWTTLTYEEPMDYNDNFKQRYYPVKDPENKNQEIYKRYTEMIPDDMTFIGRCGTYQYLDMHQVVNQSLQTAKKFISTI
jgi:UDP-galactopyranose mutase